jgi:hypothetical protein
MCANLLGLPWYYRLREEARKSWKYCVSDKIVDFNQMGMYLTQVTTTCSVFGGGRLSARFAGVGAPLFD